MALPCVSAGDLVKEMFDKNKRLISRAKTKGAQSNHARSPLGGDWAHKAGTEGSVRILLVQLNGGYGSGFSGCKWGTGLTYP